MVLTSKSVPGLGIVPCIQATKMRRQLIHPASGFEAHGQGHPTSATEGTSGPTERTSVQQKLMHQQSELRISATTMRNVLTDQWCGLFCPIGFKSYSRPAQLSTITNYSIITVTYSWPYDSTIP